MEQSVSFRLKRWLPSGVKQELRSVMSGPRNPIRDLICRVLFSRNLRVLAMIHGTDKWLGHWYAQHYEAHFAPLRRRRLNVLEIGIGEGGSLRMWRSFFPRARVGGIDIQSKSSHDEPRIRTYCGDQSDTQFLRRVARDLGRIDIVIDDGSHVNCHVLTTFHTLFPLLADGGFYAVEDTQTSYWPDDGGNPSERNDLSTSMGFFKSLVDGLNHQEFPGEHEPTYYDRHIVAMHFYHNLVIIRKGLNDESSNGSKPTST